MRSASRLDGRVNVGLALASLHTGASLTVWPAVAEAAARAGVGLFCFPGGRIGLREGYEASRNAVFELAAAAPLDGMLVWSSSLCGARGAADLDRFVDRWRDIPSVSLSEGVRGIPIVTIDYYRGMRDAVLHAIEAHGYRRIAFARGPESHPGAEERYRAFLDIMGEFGIEADPRLVTPPSAWDSGAQAVLELLDGRGLVPGRDFEALVAASDLMALSAARAFQSRGWRVPGDVAIIGMNNSLESRVAAPPMTTVDGPFARLGADALDTLLREIRGEAVPPVRKLPARLIVRQSCGCPSSSFLLAGASAEGREEAGGLPPEAAQAEGSEGLALAIARVVGLPPDLSRDWVAPLVEAWEGAVAAEAPAGVGAGRFFDYLGRVMDRAMRRGIDLGSWQDAVSLLRRSALPRLDASGRDLMEGLVGQARVLVAEAMERALSYRAWEKARRDEGLSALDHELLMALDMETLGKTLKAALPPLGIESAYVCRYEGADQARLAFGFRDGESVPGGAAFPAADLLPRGSFPARRLAYVVEPLFFHDSQIGYALFEIGGSAGELYEGLRDSVSNALRSAILFARVDDERARAERADEVKTHLLSNVSHELRAPVDLILKGAKRLSEKAGPEEADELRRIRASAEHQLRLVNDLLDLSRAEIDELDLDRAPLDPLPLLRDTFDLFARDPAPGVEWRAELPERLPIILADAQRIRQILMNMLGNAAKFTRSGSILLSASVDPPKLRVSVADTGPGIAPERLPHIFEPFLSASGAGAAGPGGRSGIGLGLSISRHLALLHFGDLEAESQEGEGSTFTLSLPLPNLGSLAVTSEGPAGGCVLVVSASGAVPAEVEAIAGRRGLAARRIRLEEVEAGLLESLEPAALAWDMEGAGTEEWALFRKLRQRPRLASLPFLLLGAGSAGGAGSPAFLAKGAPEGSLADALVMCCPPGDDQPVLIADDDEDALDDMRAAVAKALPGAEIRTARDGEAAWAAARERPPRLAILDLMMPGASGTELVARFRSDERLRAVPILLMTNKVVSSEDLRAIEGYSRIALHNKGVWTEEDAAAGVARLAGGDPPLPAATSAVVKRCIAYMNRYYATAVARWKLAEAVNVSEDYLSRIFRRELGITPWEYLSRLRVKRAKELLAGSAESVAMVGEKVGFPDQAYFSRVFRKVAGMSPQAYRESAGKRNRAPERDQRP